MDKPPYNLIRDWFNAFDGAAKLEGWLLTNDSDNNYCIARLDDPLNMAGVSEWPRDFTEPKFQDDEAAVEFVRRKAAGGSQLHAIALAIHEAGIPVARADPSFDRPIHEYLLEQCSAGPWQHGLHLPGFSADSQPCIYGDERQFPLAILDKDDHEAWANVVLMAAGYELCQELSKLVDVWVDSNLAMTLGDEAFEVRQGCNSALALLSRIKNDLERPTEATRSSHNHHNKIGRISQPSWHKARDRRPGGAVMNLLFYVLVHEHQYGQSLYGFCYQPTKARPYPSVLPVVEKLGVERSAGESVSLHPIENNPPDLVLSASEVGSREPEFLDISE